MPAAISHWLSLVWQPFLIILNLPSLTPRPADRRHTLDRHGAVTVEDIVLRMRAVRTAVHPQRIVDRIRPKPAALYAGLWIDSGFSDEPRVPGGVAAIVGIDIGRFGEQGLCYAYATQIYENCLIHGQILEK